MSEELKQAQERIIQLEKAFAELHWALPPKPDPTLAEDEWHVIFSDHTDLTNGTISKIPWKGGLNTTSTFIVKRWHKLAEAEKQWKFERMEHALKWLGFSCLECPQNKTCQYAWDAYNTGGDCLAEKFGLSGEIF